MSHLSPPLYSAPISARHSVDIARRPNNPPGLVITAAGRVRISHTVMAEIRFASVIFWKYLGTDGFNIIEADEWEADAENCQTLRIMPPAPEKRMDYFFFTIPSSYRVGVRAGDYSSRIETSKSDGRGVISVPCALDPKRFYRVW